MCRVCVLVGEGKSEKSFFSSLLLNQFNFKETEQKGCILYQSKEDNDLFWLFPIPSIGQTHKGGKKMLEKKETYIISKTIVNNNKRFFGNNPEIFYRIATDTDGGAPKKITTRENAIKKAIDKANLDYIDFKILFSNLEIESWFIGGLTTSFPSVKNNDTTKTLIAQSNSEILKKPKVRLDAVLERGLSGNRHAIARDFGKHINFQQALTKSKSFLGVFNALFSDNLLIKK